MKKWIIKPVNILTVSVLAVILIYCGEGLEILDSESSFIDWTAWSYRRPVAIQENSSSTLTGYQVNISFTNTNFSFSNADSTGKDLRFSYNGTSLNYWLESWDQGGETGSVWVKVPSLPAGVETTIYVYYGNAGVAAASSFDGTFIKNFDTPNLVARWHMDEGSGSSVNDSSANSNTGTITGATWVGSDGGGWYDRSDVSFSTGDSLSFDGSGDYVTVSDDDTLDIEKITLECWIKTGSDVTTTQYVISKWEEVDGLRSFALSIEAGRIYFLTTYLGTIATLNSLDGGAISSDTWYHVAVTSDGTNKRFYINGSAGNSTGWAQLIRISTSDVQIGAYDSPVTNSFYGTIAEISIYNQPLSAQDIEAHSKRVKYFSPPPTYNVGAEEIVQ